MIPLRLHLTDFLSYRSMPAPLDLAQVTLACLSGPNGHGKSALLDAITWSLWGKARGCEGGQEQERLIRDGADAMRVEFVFSLDGDTYRVARSRWRNGKADLAFNVEAGDGSWTDLSGEGITDTQRRVVERLRMDYETFVASAFILQGRADTFTKLGPKERKEVLGKILGLEIYERLAERAKERRKDAQSAAETHSAILASLEADLAERPDLESRRAEAESSLALAGEHRTEAEAAVAGLQAQLSELLAVEAAAREATKRLREAERSLADGEAEVARLVAEADRLEREAAIEPATAQHAAGLPALEARERSMEEARRRHEELSGEAASLTSRIEQEKARLETEGAGRERTAAALQREVAAEPEARVLLERVRVEIARLDEAAAERETLLARHAEIRERIGALEAQRASRQAESAEIRDKRALLDRNDAGCPLCGQELTAEHREEVRAGFAARLADLERAEAGAAEEKGALAAELEAVAARGAELRAALDRRETLTTQAARLASELDQLSAAGRRIAAEREAASELARRIATDDYAAGEREKLARVREELASVGFVPADHDALKHALRVAREAERALSEARRAEAALAATRDAVVAAAARVTAARDARDRAQRDLDAMGERLTALPGVGKELDAAERSRAEAQRGVEAAGQTLAATVHALEALDRKAEEAEAARTAYAEAKRTAGLYEKLSKAFGRDGIPARIIGNAIPDLRIEANRLLGLLTDGQLSLSIDPVKETKSRALKETLEVTVYDATGGKRPYEMYSGGERLRIDFALRVALSRLLANRAGARLETLVVDEGFGSQDAEGRARLLEAILRVRSEFRTVLVITHIDELKEHFPVRIEVRKDPDRGSLVSVV